MQKKEARLLFRKKRLALSAAEKVKYDDLLLIQFQTLYLPFLSQVLSFYPLQEQNEINSFLCTRYLQFQNPGLQISYPKITGTNGLMTAIIPLGDDDFIANEYNIPEPAAGISVQPHLLDLVLIPLLAFDKMGNRVGYGKGFYDRFLPHCRTECLKIGLSYFEPVDRIDDANGFDVPLDFCITPQKAYVF